jgi:hypothetical protein
LAANGCRSTRQNSLRTSGSTNPAPKLHGESPLERPRWEEHFVVLFEKTILQGSIFKWIANALEDWPQPFPKLAE